MKRFCSVGLQADTVDSSTCPPKGGRYIDRNRVLTLTLQAWGSDSYCGGDIPLVFEAQQADLVQKSFVRNAEQFRGARFVPLR